MSYSESQLKLKAHIEAENNQNSDSFSSVVTDIEHWAEYGVFDIPQYERHMALESYVTVFRDIYGTKPFIDFDSMATEEIISDMNSMIESERKDQEEQASFQAKLLKERKENNKPIPNRPFADLKSMMQGA